jgi:hypothetical protein
LAVFAALGGDSSSNRATEKLVALQAEDRLEALDVLLTEEAIAPWVSCGAGVPDPRGSGSSRSRRRKLLLQA